MVPKLLTLPMFVTFYGPRELFPHNSCGTGRTSKKAFSQDCFSAINSVLKDATINIDFVCLQETHTPPNHSLNAARPFGRNYNLTCHSGTARNSSDGVMIFARSNINLISSETWTEGRVLYACFKHPDHTNKTHLINVYNHTTLRAGRNIQSAELIQNIVLKLQAINIERNDVLIICGDFNFDLTSPPSNLAQSAKDLLDLPYLKDCFNNGEHTWRGVGARANKTSKLDYILANRISNYNYCKLYNNAFSDHKVLVVAHKTNLPSTPKPNRYNCNTLKNTSFRAQLKSNISKHLCATINKPFVENDSAFVSLDNPNLYEDLPFQSASLLNSIISITKQTHDNSVILRI